MSLPAADFVLLLLCALLELNDQYKTKAEEQLTLTAFRNTFNG